MVSDSIQVGNLSFGKISARLLLKLIEANGQVVRHDDLIRAGWPDSIQSDPSLPDRLKANIYLIKQKLDLASHPRTIVAMKGKGYALVERKPKTSA